MGPLILLQFLYILVTAGSLLAVALIIIRYWFLQKKRLSPSISSDDGQKIILPLRLQAYERIILFLERISPANLIMRVNKPEMNSVQLQSALVKVIREEFEYNLSQQLYISPKAWELVKNAKEETIKLINIASGKTQETSASGELVKALIDLSVETDQLPVSLAIDAIKNEMQKLF